jgi:hypothetical protein
MMSVYIIRERAMESLLRVLQRTMQYTSIQLMRELKLEVHQAIIDKGWKMTVEPKVSELLRIHFEHNDNGSVTLTQCEQLKRVRGHFFPEIDYSDIPQEYVLIPKGWTPEESRKSLSVTVNKFLGRVGVIMYLLRTHLDIATAISILSGKGKSPTELDDILQHIY